MPAASADPPAAVSALPSRHLRGSQHLGSWRAARAAPSFTRCRPRPPAPPRARLARAPARARAAARSRAVPGRRARRVLGRGAPRRRPRARVGVLHAAAVRERDDAPLGLELPDHRLHVRDRGGPRAPAHRGALRAVGAGRAGVRLDLEGAAPRRRRADRRARGRVPRVAPSLGHAAGRRWSRSASAPRRTPLGSARHAPRRATADRGAGRPGRSALRCRDERRRSAWIRRSAVALAR